MNGLIIKNKNKIFKTFLGNIIDFEKYPTKIGPTEIEKFTDIELYDYCRFTGLNAKIWSRRFIAALPEVEKRRLYRNRGFYSIYEFASKVGGISNNTVNVVLWLHEILKDRPGLRDLIGEVGIHKIRLVIKIVTKENEKFWIQKVREMSKSALEVLVREIRHDNEVEILEEDNKQKNNSLIKQIYPGINLPKTQKDTLFNHNELINTKILNSEIAGAENDFQTYLASKLATYKRLNFSVSIDKETEFGLRKFKMDLEKKLKKPVDWNQTLKEMTKLNKTTN